MKYRPHRPHRRLAAYLRASFAGYIRDDGRYSSVSERSMRAISTAGSIRRDALNQGLSPDDGGRGRCGRCFGSLYQQACSDGRAHHVLIPTDERQSSKKVRHGPKEALNGKEPRQAANAQMGKGQ